MATKPQFSPDQDMSNVTPEDVADAKRRAKESAAYDRALRNTEMAPAPKAPASAAKPRKYAAGGYTKAADGIAQRGKTRGKMC
jgi:hypothetical protein